MIFELLEKFAPGTPLVAPDTPNVVDPVIPAEILGADVPTPPESPDPEDCRSGFV